MARWLGWIAIALTAAYVVFIGGTWQGIYQSGLRTTTVLITAGLLACWGWLVVRDPAWQPRSRFALPIALALGSLAVSTWFSRDQRISLEYLGYAVLIATVYLLAVALFRQPFFRDRLLGLAGLLFGVIVGAYLVLDVAHWIHWWSVVGHLAVPPLRPEFEALTYANPSTVVAIVVPLGIPVAARWGGTSARGIATIVAVVLLIGAVALISGSRAGWFAIGVTAIVAVIAWLAGRGRRATLRAWLGRIARRRASAVAAGALAVVVALLAASLLPAILRRAAEGGEDLRITYWVIALRLFAQAPIFGTGPGTWVIQRIGQTQGTEIDYYIPHAHDVPVQTLAELGVVGALVGWFAIVAVVRLLRDATRSGDPGLGRWAWVAGLGLLSLALHDLLDFFPNFPSVLVAAALPIAYLDAMVPPGVRPAPRRGPRPEWSRLAGLAMGIATVLAVTGLVLQELPARTLEVAVDDANRGDWAAALQPAMEAAAADPAIHVAAFTAGLAADRAGDHPAAAASFRIVAEFDQLPEAWLDLAAEQAHIGDPGGALTSLRAALRVGIQRPAVAMASGDLALRLGDATLARTAFLTAIAGTPSIAGDPWWTADPARAAAFPGLVDAAITAAGPANKWEIALMAGDPARARALFGQSGLDPVLVDVIPAWGGDAAARERLIAVCHASPLDLTLLTWCARLDQRAGLDAEAANLRYLADAQIAGTGSTSAEVRVTPSLEVGRLPAGFPALYWGTFTYRRNTPFDMLVPSLVHLVYE